MFIEGFSGFARDTTTAIATLRRLVRLYPDEKDGRILFAGQLAAARGADDPESRRLLEETLRLDPLYASGYNMLAYSHAATGDFVAADSLVRRYVELEPDEPNPLDSRGEILEFAGRLDEARDAYLAALGVQPDFLYALDHLTRLHLRSERPDRARRDLASRLAAESPEVRVRAHLLVGDSYLWEGDIDAAGEAYAEADRIAVEAGRSDLRASALQDRIRVDLSLGRFAEAEDEAREIRTVQPLSGWWITVLYDSLARVGDIEGMERWKPRVAAELGANPLTRANVGVVSDLLSVLIAHERGQHELVLSLAAELPANLRPGAVTGWPVFESMLALGRTDELLAALRPMTRPAPFTTSSRLVPLVGRSATYYEGRAYEMAGDTARAVERYRTLVAGMGDGLERLWFLADTPDRLRALTPED